MLLAADFSLGDALSVVFVAGLFAIWLGLIILLLADLYADPEPSGLAKAGWTAFIIFLPLIGIFTYLVVRGDRMGRRVGSALASRRATDD